MRRQLAGTRTGTVCVFAEKVRNMVCGCNRIPYPSKNAKCENTFSKQFLSNVLGKVTSKSPM